MSLASFHDGVLPLVARWDWALNQASFINQTISMIAIGYVVELCIFM